ncbi:MAG: DUF3786 domain-containing protein [Spirochaetaceae bacterium]|nr:DUF3786 domain-containing protein [Spirochaetaceae bacterium]
MDNKKKYWEPKLWDELRSRNPIKICAKCLVEHDSSGFFKIKSLEKEIRVYPKEEKIESEDSALAADPDFQLLIISYLLFAQHIEPIGKWISEKDLKGGSLFFRGPHALPSVSLEKYFGNNPDLLREKGRELGATELEFGDISLCFPVLPLISLTIVLWLKDDEFPARVTFMMDPSIEAHLPLDVISAMVQSVTKKLISH